MQRGHRRPTSRAFPPAARLVALTAAAALLASCTPAPPALEQIRARHELRVVTLNLPTSYYLGARGTEGLEFELARSFAAQLGVSLSMYPVANERAMQAALDSGQADIAAAQLTATSEWRHAGKAAEPYARIPQFVVYQRDNTKPRSTLQLETAKLAVRAGSPQERMLEHLRRTTAPTLKWVETAPTNADPLADVDSGNADYAIIDAREFSFSHHLYPDVMVGFSLPTDRPVQWIVRRGADDLLDGVNRFFQQMRESGRMVKLLQQSTGDVRSFAYEESREFQTHLADRLPRFRPWFEQASEESGIDWRLLAAVGYQESKWDATAQSNNGALGVMMLTSDTADSMGVKDRTNAQQSIFAGAKYLAEVREKVPDRIPEPDRTWFTVAAYNVGFGHLEDARVLAQMDGKNPDSWADVRDELPRLAEERWFTKVKHGYARGWEPAQFVERVQRYLTLLEWQPGEGLASQGTRVQTAFASGG
jgi:membrane-bound lytic murein transglycosylase F